MPQGSLNFLSLQGVVARQTLLIHISMLTIGHEKFGIAVKGVDKLFVVCNMRSERYMRR